MKHKKIFQFSSAILLATASCLSYNASAEAIRDQVGVTAGARFGTLGLGAELAFPINNSSAIRVNAAYLPLLNQDLTKMGLQGKATINNTNAMALVDWHPFQNAFRFSFGGAMNSFNMGIKDVKYDVGPWLSNAIVEMAATSIQKYAADKGGDLAAATAKAKEVVAKLGDLDTNLGPINAEATLENKWAFVAGVGADNSYDPDASFIYGFDINVMLVNPTLKITHSTQIANLTQSQINTLESELKEGVASLNNTLKEKFNGYLAIPIDVVSKNLPLIGSSSGTSTSSFLGSARLVPSIMGHIAIPLQ